MTPAWEYTQDGCDVWQIAHLCNHFAEHGWDVVSVVESHEGMKVPERAGDPNGPLASHKALRPYVVLFRRPFVAEVVE